MLFLFLTPDSPGGQGLDWFIVACVAVGAVFLTIILLYLLFELLMVAIGYQRDGRDKYVVLRDIYFVLFLQLMNVAFTIITLFLVILILCRLRIFQSSEEIHNFAHGKSQGQGE